MVTIHPDHSTHTYVQVLEDLTSPSGPVTALAKASRSSMCTDVTCPLSSSSIIFRRLA